MSESSTKQKSEPAAGALLTPGVLAHADGVADLLTAPNEINALKAPNAPAAEPVSNVVPLRAETPKAEAEMAASSTDSVSGIIPAASTASAASAEAASVGGTVGQRLKRGREAKGWSVADLAQRLKRPLRQIDALEADNFAPLPNATHLRGFVRAYAGAVGLNPDSIAMLLPGREGAAPKELSPGPRLNAPFPQPGAAAVADRGWLVGALAILLLVSGYGAYAWFSPSLKLPAVAVKPVAQTPSSAPTQAATTPVSEAAPNTKPEPVAAPPTTMTPVALPSASPLVSAVTEFAPPSVEPTAQWQDDKLPPVVDSKGTGPIRMVFGKASWVEVRDGKGNVIHQKTHQPGDDQSVEGTGPFKLVIGNSRDVKLTYNGEAIDLVPHTKASAASLTLK